MIRLLQIEWKKILTYKIFWVLIGLYFIFLALGIMMAEFMINNMIDNVNRHTPIPIPHITIYFFPWVWQNITFFASLRYVLIFPAIIVIILITNEFTYKTVRQNVINGLSKTEFILSKLIIITLISAVLTVFLLVGTLILGFSNTAQPSFSMVVEKSTFVIGFFISVMTFQVFAFFFGFIFRNTGLSIALFTLYTFIVEPIIYYFLKSPIVFKNDISAYLPVNSFLRITEYPAIPVLKQVMGLNLQDGVTFGSCLIAMIYASLLIGIVWYTMSKRDL
jgi:ABC-type transport system involved in multi-copper enzyme maturation permease subunit